MKIEIPPFQREKHIYRTEEFDELIKDIIRFFNGTPIVNLPPPEKFDGTGVYALYYIGKFKLYKKLYEINRLEFRLPIYVGKAVPEGWRNGRKRDGSSSHGFANVFGSITLA